ncbi:NAD-dependent epimerase/dehydratase family protein [Pseudomonas sp. JQ170]|uniref:NAD-dependent epimerase/dehydratase family protein n=1 Tax=unclassified Pseudomonas TaxID=196821 RepID=UPI002656A127|nr:MULTISPECIES: NAD-dependent epimerase/dehydratase family protein [unclassified Pseudomonas]MDN7143436.1 NAD-dependent epimerase/dehydratase family protein [Pseudomonas sp. JQ170]WRO73923.1 NAD-dependent epimerase/dehydratase family protein [Pseudomonas sp. 170C]
MSAKRILVTGGAGFIGSHLVDKLLSRHYQVRVLDNLSSGKKANLPLDNPALELQVGDVADAEVVNQALQGCSAVVHLAAVASVQASVDDPAGTHRSNFIGTLNVCQGMAAAGIKRVVFASSAAVYGSNGEGTAIDEDTPKAPLTPYAADKLASEFYLDFYRRQHGLEPVVLRFFNIFGPRQDPSSPYSGVISIFVEKGRNRQPVTVFGDGEQTRDFVYVADLVEILLQALQTEEPASGAVNVGLGRTTSLNQLIKAIDAATDNPLSVSYQAARPGDIRHSRADNRRLLQRFKLNEPTTVADGLRCLLRSL